MGRKENLISKILKERRWTAEVATWEIYKNYRKEFELREIVWTTARFNLVKLGYDETKWLREVLAEFFGIKEKDIPRRDKRTKRARDLRCNPMDMSREARRRKKKTTK